MRQWARCRARLMLCMGCAGEVKRGDPVQEIRLAGVKRVLMRCAKCADGAPPDDLPELPPLTPQWPAPSGKPSGHGMTPMKQLADVVDFKQKQTGDVA